MSAEAIELQPAFQTRVEDTRRHLRMATATTTVRVAGELHKLTARQSWVAEDHPIVLARPDLFASREESIRERSRIRDESRLKPSERERLRAERARTRTRAVQDAPARKLERTLAQAHTPRPRWNPLVRLDARSAPTFTVRLEREAYLSMVGQAFGQRGAIETGGALFGIPAAERDDAVKVKQASEPGPRTRSSYSRMHVDVDHIRAEAIDLERRGALARWVGHWHTHPTVRSGQPSEHDLRFFAWDCRELHHMGRSMDHFIGLILTPNWHTDRSTHEPYACWARPTLHAWHMHPVSDDQFICTRANIERLW
jgi:hypothetical protein